MEKRLIDTMKAKRLVANAEEILRGMVACDNNVANVVGALEKLTANAEDLEGYCD